MAYMRGFGTVSLLRRALPRSTPLAIRTPFPAKRLLSAGQGATLEEVYSKPLRYLHWAMAGGMISIIGLVKVAQEKKGKEKAPYMKLHKSIGLLMLGGIALRIGVRVASRIPLPIAGNSALENKAGEAAHYALYGLMIFLPVSGVVKGLNDGRGLPFFDLFHIPSLENKDPAIAKSAIQYHILAGQALEILIPLHIGVAFFHFFRGQVIFSRMNPFLH
eukprot:m.336695 g.336695  ORF g.336695 m.336695 type:complete len:218 (+) comp17933_c0_seq1:55-708(+)